MFPSSARISSSDLCSSSSAVSGHCITKHTLRRTVVASASSRDPENVLTFQEIREIGRRRGVDIYVRELGPFFRIVVRDLPEDDWDSTKALKDPAPLSSAGPSQITKSSEIPPEEDEHSILGLITGFTAPLLGILHLDTMQVFNRRINRPGEPERAHRIRASILGLGFLLGAASIVYGHEKGCKKGELLAINDDDLQHRQLVRFYQRFGWQPVREVTGGELADLPHMLVWGGAGTRMDIDLAVMVRSRWVRALRESQPRMDPGGAGMMVDHAADEFSAAEPAPRSAEVPVPVPPGGEKSAAEASGASSS